MGEKGMERRLCQRFKIAGATVSYRRNKLFSSKAKVDEEFCPVLDLSRGGVRFLTQKPEDGYVIDELPTDLTSWMVAADYGQQHPTVYALAGYSSSLRRWVIVKEFYT